MSEIITKARTAQQVKDELALKSQAELNEALECIAEMLETEQAYLLAENKKDLAQGKQNGLSASLIDRLTLTSERISEMSQGIRILREMDSPIGETMQTIQKENGLQILQKAVPIGVVGMIYEARPNVTIDAASLCLKTGNAVILRGSSSAKYSNQAIVSVIHRALRQTNIPEHAVQLIEDTSRKSAQQLFTLKEYIDVLIPRGGQRLIQTVVEQATVPVIETGAGICHVFIDKSADFQMAVDIVINAKTQRPSVCNAIETIIIHKDWLHQHGKALLDVLHLAGVELRGDVAAQAVYPGVIEAREEDWQTEYNDLIANVKTVNTLEEALAHIRLYSTKHSEAIITKEQNHADLFQKAVDAAAVYHNASTRFTDGFEFGFGAEIGISTQKLHVRGPMGLRALTSTKYVITGEGQIR